MPNNDAMSHPLQFFSYTSWARSNAHAARHAASAQQQAHNAHMISDTNRVLVGSG